MPRFKRGFKEKRTNTLTMRTDLIEFSLKEPYSEEEVKFVEECIKKNCYYDPSIHIFYPVKERVELSELKMIIFEIYGRPEIAKKIISLEKGRVYHEKTVGAIRHRATKIFKKLPF